MALQSSGQIKLSEIATEFGGTAPHSMSEYYAGGTNVPSGTGSIPTSGEIQLAADFYGTSAVTYLANTTVNSGTAVIKSGCQHNGYSSTGAHATSGVYGSIGSAAISGTSTTILAVYFRDDSPSGFSGPDVLRIVFSTANFTGWTTLTVSRADGSAQYVVNRSAASLTSNGHLYYWNYSNSSTNPFVGQTAAIVQLT